MKLKKGALDNLILVVGASFLIGLLLLHNPQNPWADYPDTLRYASATLKGQVPFSDFAADVVGARALFRRTEPYPVLGPAFKELGIDWPVMHGSNHPPTAYLLAMPVAFFNWPVASAVWAWLMLCLIALSCRLYGLSWKISLGLAPLALAWPPASASLGQVTIVWMFGLALAYYFRERRLFASGLSVGLASASKIFPGLVMLLFLLKRKWAALLGFLCFWAAALSLVLVLNPAALQRYFEENRSTSIAILNRPDNASLVTASYRYGGLPGAGAIVLFFALILFLNRRYLSSREGIIPVRAWMLASYFAVASLPVFWIYSLMPLLPVIIFLLAERKLATTIIALYCLLVPSVYIHGGDISVIPMASVSVAAGLGFILDRLPLKIFQKRWGKESYEF